MSNFTLVMRESHLMSAELTDPGLIRVVLAGLPVATAINTPAGTIAITRDQVVKAGLDTLAVSRWLQPLGGYGAIAYLRPSSHRMTTSPVRPALHPIQYFVVPLTAVAIPKAEEEAGGMSAVG
jgi:hypothetical protein